MPSRAVAAIAVLAVLACAVACRPKDAAPPQPVEQIMWRNVGSWSGHGNSQTESFSGDSGALRVRWETHGESGEAGPFRLTAHSAISGRILEQVVDHRGTGSGVGYVSQDPHTFYMSVESDGVAWSFTVDEGIPGQVVGGKTAR
jgi:hypothetical protein